MPHHKGICFLIFHHVRQKHNRKYADKPYHEAMQMACRTSAFEQRRNDAAEHRKKDAEERYIMYEVYMMFHIIPLPPLSSFSGFHPYPTSRNAYTAAEPEQERTLLQIPIQQYPSEPDRQEWG